MKENKQDDENLINNSVNTNIKKFRVAFEFENQKTPLIIELSIDEKNKKILPDNKYFDKIYDNLKSKLKCDIKQVALKQWSKYLENEIEGYHAQISEYPEDSYGDYLILVLFLEMVQYHWDENKSDQKNIWYNVESLQDLSRHFPRSVLDVNSHSQKSVGGEIFNNCADCLKSNLVKIVFIDDFPMEVVPQLFKLQNFCTKPLKVDVTPFNLGKRIDYDKNDNKNRTEKVVKEVKKILGIKDDATDPKNSVESNLPKKKAVSNLKFVWVETMSQSGVATDWFLDNLCGRDNTDEQNRVAYASHGNLGFNLEFDPDINRKQYAPFLDNQITPNAIEVKQPGMIKDPCGSGYITSEEFRSRYLGVIVPEDIEEQEEQEEPEGERERARKRKRKNIDNNTKEENKTGAQKSKGQLMLTWILLVLCGIIFVGTPLGAYLFGVLFAWKIGIPVVGIMIFSGLGFEFLLAELKQQNSDISLSSDNKDTDYPKTSVEYESPLLENRIKNKDVSNELNDRSN